MGIARLPLLGLAAVLSLVLRSARQRFSQPWQGWVTFRALAVGALLTGLFLDVFQYSYRSGTPANVTIDSYRDDPPTAIYEPVNKSSPVYQACYVQPLTWQAERLDEPDDERKKIALETPAYVNTYTFTQFDPCRVGFLSGEPFALRCKNCWHFATRTTRRYRRFWAVTRRNCG